MPEYNYVRKGTGLNQSFMEEYKCAYGIILMAFYWTTEAIPLPVTALLPVIIFPVMGISKVVLLSSKYFSSAAFVLLGGLSNAIAIERWNVHRRLGLFLLLVMGTKPKWLILGFMVSTGFLSMWITNTAATTMMIPIAQAVLLQLISVQLSDGDTTHNDVDNNPQNNEKAETTVNVVVDNTEVSFEMAEDVGRDALLKTEGDINFQALDPPSQNMLKAMLLSICYATACGGAATLTGTPANLVMKGLTDFISDGQAGITFASYFVFAFPICLINLVLAWLLTQVFFFGISFPEKAVIGHLILLVLAWFTLSPDFVPGWGYFFPKGYVNDAVPAAFVTCLLFVFPSSKKRDDVAKADERTLLDWNTFNRKLPWGMFLLLGGGFALAQSCQDSGLSIWIATKMAALANVPSWAVVLIVCVVMSPATEVASNVAVCTIFLPILVAVCTIFLPILVAVCTIFLPILVAVCTIFLPILADMAKGLQIHPVCMMFPAAMSASFSFMLPVATPSNTVAFSYGYLKFLDMVKHGCVLNFLGVLVVTLAINTWGMAYFRLDVFPEWAKTVGTATVLPNCITTLPPNTTTPI